MDGMSVPGLNRELADQLQRLGVTLGPAAPPAAAAAATAAAAAPLPGVVPIEAAVPGRQVANAHGTCYVSTARRGAAEPHGGVPLAAARAASTVSLAALARDAAIADLDLGRAAFVDTETTGLAGGSGTYAFLIGAGRFVGDTFQVRQFFMRDPAEEPAQLAEVMDWLADASGLVTFNGRTFDLPLLRTRFALNYLQLPVADGPHLDLLPPARRLWRRRLPSCALQSLEYHVFGLERQDDVPGWLIPDRYFRFQADGDARPLVGIFQHNVTDILTMVSLTSHLARAYGEPHAMLDHGRDWLSLAAQYLALGQLERAMAACDTALTHTLPERDVEEALGLLGAAAKKAGDWERALAAWSRLMAMDPPPRLYPFEEVAKYHEHQARRPQAALAVCERARELLDASALRPRRGRRRALAELDHRLARLRRKVGASAS